MIDYQVATLPTAIDLSTKVFRTWKPDRTFILDQFVIVDGHPYVCKLHHLASYTNRPGAGTWATYWTQTMFPNARYYVTNGDGVTEYLTDSAGAVQTVTSSIAGLETALAGIPTVDPAVEGELWSNLGVVTISAGA